MTLENPSSTVVVGLGVTGLACVRYLVERGVSVSVTDSRDEPPGLMACQAEFPDVPLFLGALPPTLLAQASEIILSPGVSLREPAIAAAQHAGKSIIGDIELFARENDKPVVAITGSNGKTTVTTLLGLMVERSGKKAVVCGNIGKPVLEALLAPAPDYYVMELSSFQLETTHSLQSKTAVVLNVSPDHLDRYASYEDYVAAKQRIYSGCQCPVVNRDERVIWDSLGLIEPLSFSLRADQHADFCLKQVGDQTHLMQGDVVLIEASEIRLQGPHHWQNALAALALGHALGLPMEAMLAVLRSFSGLPHRCQWVRDYQGVHWYNDSKGTNVGAARSAINSLGHQAKGKVIVIAGGLAKGTTERDFLALRQPMQDYVSHLILIGQDAPLLEGALKAVVPVSHAQAMQDAVSIAARLAKPNDVVVLSPACASFDMFDHFEHRGNVFIEAVQALC